MRKKYFQKLGINYSNLPYLNHYPVIRRVTQCVPCVLTGPCADPVLSSLTIGMPTVRPAIDDDASPLVPGPAFLFPVPCSLVPALVDLDHGERKSPILVCNRMKPINLVVFFCVCECPYGILTCSLSTLHCFLQYRCKKSDPLGSQKRSVAGSPIVRPEGVTK